MVRLPSFFLHFGCILLIAQTHSAEVKTVQIRSTLDGSEQPSLLYLPANQPSDSPLPLVVHLHSWSAHYDKSTGLDEALAECRRRKWICIAPEFRGPNNRPEACASRLAMQDILDAVDFVQKQAKVNPKRIYLVGGSGGGHMSLVMAARYPKRWTAVSAWVPITDLAAWHTFSEVRKAPYAKMLENCCGGVPGSPATDREYRNRSSLPSLAKAKGLPIAIEAGIHDGHKGSVPVSHSLRAFNVLAKANGYSKQVIAESDIEAITTQEQIPLSLQKNWGNHPERKFPTLFHREAGPASVTIFEGGHEMDFATAFRWFDQIGSR